jgi:hypothetical protein
MVVGIHRSGRSYNRTITGKVGSASQNGAIAVKQVTLTVQREYLWEPANVDDFAAVG